MGRRARKLSVRLYSTLHTVGASETLRRLHRHAAMNQEVMFTLEYDLRDIGTTAHSFGSFCEGTTTVGLRSDVDRLETVDRQPVVENKQDAPIHGRSHVIVREDGACPGYVKLHVHEDRVPMMAYFGELNLAAFDTDRTRRVYIRHVPHPFEGHAERNGPADTYRYESGASIDRVVAMEGAAIPSFAGQFVTRHRPRNWPSKKDIDAMATMGCFFVGVGHPNSSSSHTEWRLSLSKQERYLMFGLNKVQHRCYVVLKMVKNELIVGQLGKSISSYHCKTCLFHVIEHTPPALWRPENLCECVILCLTTLYQWTYHRYCPNFFVPEENMFDRTVLRIKRTKLLKTLRDLITDGCRFFFKLTTDRVGEFLANTGANLAPSARLSTSQHGTTLLVHIIEDVLHTDPRKYRVNSLGVQSGTDHPALIDLNILEWASNMTSVRGHTKMETQQSLSYLLPLLHLNLAQDLVSLWFNVDNWQASVALIKAFDYHFQKALAGYSEITAKLVLATVMYRIDRYNQCEALLQEVEMSFKPHVAPVCACQDKVFRSNVYIWTKLKTDSISLNKFLQSATAPCVQFVPSDLEIIPTALRYELFRSVGAPKGTRRKMFDYWFDFAVVDAKVYLHFLQYLVFSKLELGTKKYSAVNKLRGLLSCREENLGHRETACNLLGWVCLQEGHVGEALDWFVTSWRIKPLHNAAKWHVRQVMARILRRAQRMNAQS